MGTDRIVLGVDVGGTKIRYGLMDMKGTILADDQCRSRAMPCREWFSFITEKLDSFLKANPEGKAAQAIGLGIRGSIDHRSRRLRSSSVVRPDGFDLCGALSAYYQIPVFLENDVKASTVSELLYGEGKRTDTFACVNVGTGLAMGLVYEGKLIHGIRNNAGEIGNLLYRRSDDGETACVETVASGMGLQREACRLKKAFPNSGLFRCEGASSGYEILQACRRGEPLARKAVENTIHELAVLILNLENALDLGTYVFVGGVMSDPWFFGAVEKEIQRIAQGIHYGIFNWDAVLKISNAGAGSAGLRGACGVAVYGLKGMESRQRV